MYKCITLSFFIFTSFLMSAQENMNESIIQTDTLKATKKTKFILIPVAFFTPETNFGFGGGGQVFFTNSYNRYNRRPSNILFSGIYTLNKQITVEVIPQFYLNKGDYFLDGYFGMKIFPNSFWGIGNNMPDEDREFYNQTSYTTTLAFLKQISPKLNFGLKGRFENHKMTEVEEGKLLASGEIPGSDKAVIAGIGTIFNLDSRDNTGSPNKGSFLQFESQFSSRLFGATNGFNKFQLDLRTYIRAGKRNVLAIQIYNENTYGDVPFQSLAHYGGGVRSRGYFKGRYMDQHMYVIQSEYRMRIKNRWTLAAFLLSGEVASEPSRYFNIKNMKPAGGLGFRFKVFKDQDTWLRLDLGVGQSGNNGIYFGVNEAF